MNTLDRYIARQFLVNAVALCLILGGLIITIDITQKLDEFVDAASKMASPDGATTGLRKFVLVVLLIFDFWWPKLLLLFNYMMGLVLVGAMGFTLSQLSRQRELVAVLAGGISLRRLMRPILAVAALFLVAQTLNQELVIPRIAPLLTRKHGEAGGRQMGIKQVPLCRDAMDRVWYARAFDADQGTLADLLVIERDSEGRATRMISAPLARWRVDHWELTEGIAETPRGDVAAAEPVLRLSTNLDPTALKLLRFETFKWYLSWGQLGEMIDRARAPGSERSLAEFRRIRAGRIAFKAICILTLLISMPFFLRREPGSMMRQALKSAPVALATMIGGVLGVTATIPGMPPTLSAFIPVMILLPLAVAAVSSIRS